MVYRLLKVVLICLTIFFPISMSGEVVTQQKAMEFATRFFANHAEGRGNMVDMKLAWDSNQLSSKARSSGESPAFYVFTPSNGKGFVIVAGDDATLPVIGYSFENSITSPDQLPSNLTSWLGMVHESIVAMRSKGNVASASVKQKWMESRAGNVLVMLDTPSWNQRYPYNLQCPMDGGVRSVVGCVATAMAIVMRYHEWPKKGRGVTEEYVTDTQKIHVEARNLEHEYDWDKMKMEYIHGEYNDDEAHAVATLMADIATALESDFTSNSTIAFSSVSPSVLYKHFDYHPGMYWQSLQTYWMDEARDQKLVDEMMKNRPLLFAGYNGDYWTEEDVSGHVFVLDGCTADNYFHVNWGWGGNYDGFFYLHSLKPGDEYYNYNWDNQVLFNMFPNDGSRITDWLKGYMSANTSDFLPRLPFEVKATLFNNIAIDFLGALRLAVTDRDGNIKEWICEEMTDVTIKPDNKSYRYSFPCTITEDILIGDRIRLFYREQNSDKWERVISKSLLDSDDCESTYVQFSKRAGYLSIGFKYGVSATVWFNGQPVSKGVQYEHTNIRIDTKKLTEGVYTIKLVKGEEKKEFTFEVKPL